MMLGWSGLGPPKNLPPAGESALRAASPYRVGMVVGRTGLGPPKNFLMRGGVGAAGRIALPIWKW
jgi:hypothetical protein